MAVQRTVAILVFDDVEVLDFCGPLVVAPERDTWSIRGRRRFESRVILVGQLPTRNEAVPS
jgi:hypothetical protein